MQNRRHFILTSGTAAATISLLGGLATKAQANAEQPKFFLQIFFKGGLDASYLFDARDPLFTEKGKIQNYRTDKAGYRWTDSAGRSTLVSSLALPLEKWRNEFSILNGVHMARGFDGHPQNIAMMVTGNATGGKLFVTDLPKTLNIPLHFIAQGRFDGFESQSMEMGVSMRPDVARRLADRFKGVDPISPNSRIWNHIKNRAAVTARSGGGSFSKGSAQLLAGLSGSADIIEKQRTVRLCKEEPGAGCDPEFRIDNTDQSLMTDSLKTSFEYFQRGLAASALVSIRYELDTHDKVQAQSQENEIKKVSADLDTLFQFLKKPFDAARGLTFGDVTTVVVSSEFSRTMRQTQHAITETGTDHNPFTNTVLLAGRGFKKGLIVGATDLSELNSEGEFINVSPAHLKIDRDLVLPMGRVFDHDTLATKPDLPEEYDDFNYLSWLNVVNTIYQLNRVSTDKFKTFTRTGPPAKALAGLLS